MTVTTRCRDAKGSALYATDIIAWASDQARLLRTGRLDRLDVEHLAEEIEDVGKSEQRDLASRMAVRWHICSHGSSSPNAVGSVGR